MFKKKSDYIKIISNDIKRQMKQQMLTKTGRTCTKSKGYAP